MKTKKACIFCEAQTDGRRLLCDECETLRVLVRSKSTRTVVRFMELYNSRHGCRFTYGQFINLCYTVEAKRQAYENGKRKEKRIKKI